MKTAFLALGALALALGLGPYAQANPITFNFSGAGGHISSSIAIAPDTVSGDPAGAYTITNISGTFSDANIGISGASITGILAINPVNPPRGAPVPDSLSLIPVTNAPPPDSTISSLSYDNLYFPGGSPNDCPDYPFFGGSLDVYGAMFTLDNGDLLGVWSDGVTPGVGLTYGFGVIQPMNSGNSVLDYQFAGVVAPEPGWFWLFGFALLGVFAWRRRSPVPRLASAPRRKV